MGKFKQNDSGGFGRRSSSRRFSGRPSGRRFENRDNDSGKRRFGGNRDRGFRRGRESGRGFSRRPPEMHEAICDKCGKKCEVPFKPTEGKPIYCRECFEKNGSSRNRDSKPFQSEGMSPEQFKQLNEKLDKILAFLENLEIEEDFDEDSEDDSEDESDEDSEDDSKEETEAK